MGQVMDTKTSKKICKGILLLKSRQTERPLKKGMRAHTELEKGLFLFCLAMGNIFGFFPFIAHMSMICYFWLFVSCVMPQRAYWAVQA